MFKKILSILLCLLICCSSLSVLSVEVAAVGNAKSIFTVSSSPVEDELLRYTVSVTSQQKGIAGIHLLVNYDSNVLEPVRCGPAKTTNDNQGEVNNFEGTYAYGVTQSDKNVYSIAYMNSVAVSTDAVAKKFFNIVFKVIDSSKPKTDISFYCKEYYSISEDENNISVGDGLQEIAVYPDVATLEAPELKTVEPVREGFNITWEPVAGSFGYVVYRSSPSSSKEIIAQVEGAESVSYTDTGLKSGVTYTYSITAVNASGQSAHSQELYKKFIAKPQISSVQNVVGGVEIRWSATDGAEQYNIMRREKGSTDWTKIGVRVAGIDTVYKDTTVEDGKEYEYDINSATDSFVSVSDQYGTGVLYTKAPQITSGSNVIIDSKNGIEIKWTAHANATSYVVYRKANGIDTAFQEYATENTNSFFDTQVQLGRGYTYTVKTCTNFGESAYDLNGYTVTCVPAVEVKSMETGMKSVTVYWDAQEGAKSYNIYRKTGSSAWVKVGIAGEDAVSFEDMTVSSGVQYIYAVTVTHGTANSESAKIESSPIYFIKAPQDVRAINEYDGILLEWEAVGGAELYDVYRKENDGSMLKIATVEETSDSYMDRNVSFGSTYTYTVVAIGTMGSSKTSLESNSLLRLEAIGSTTPVIDEKGIRVTWDASPLAETYAVYRNDGTNWQMIAETSETFYVDVNVKSDVTYCYAVAAMKGDSIGILNVNDPQYLRYIAPVSKITVKNCSGYANVSWKAVDGAVNYYLYRANTKNGTYKLIKTLRGNELSYKDKNVSSGVTRYYKVKCYNGENYSVMSGYKANLFLGKVTVKAISNIYGGQTITWNGVKGAENYKLYKKAPGDKEYKLVKTFDDEARSYTYKKPENGASMKYIVKASKGDYVGAYKYKSKVYVTAPKVTVSNTSSGLKLKWAKNKVATSYSIYRKTGSAKKWTYVTDVKTNSYTDKNVKVGVKYKYTVKAYKGKYISGFYENGWTAVRLTAPKLKSVTNGYNRLKFTWNKVKGANTYYVYRKGDGDRNWVKIGSTKKTYFNDKNVNNRKLYKYTVSAVNGKSVSVYNSSGKSARYIQAPTLNVQNAKTGIYISWDRISGANSYYLYRKAGSAKSWTKIDTVTGNSYLDTNVKPGVVYTYTIRSYGSRDLSGYNSAGWSIMHLQAPTLVSANVSGRGIKVKWTKVSYATSYIVYRKGERDNTWTKIATVKGGNKLTYTDKNVEYDDSYTYTVRACRGKYQSYRDSMGITCRYR